MFCEHGRQIAEGGGGGGGWIKNCACVSLLQWRSQLDKWGGGHIHIFVFTDRKNNQFQKKLIMQNTNI